MTIDEAITALDEVIPPPDDRMVDCQHIRICAAWQELKRELARYRALGTVEELDEALYNSSL